MARPTRPLTSTVSYVEQPFQRFFPFLDRMRAELAAEHGVRLPTLQPWPHRPGKDGVATPAPQGRPLASGKE